MNVVGQVDISQEMVFFLYSVLVWILQERDLKMRIAMEEISQGKCLCEKDREGAIRP